jgi:lysophospholipase L1-like esterase
MTPVLGTLAALAALLFMIEAGFRVWHRRQHGRDYFVALKFLWGKGHVVSHPFLTFAYRKNGVIDQNQRLPYPLCPDRYRSFHKPLRLNSLGHFGTEPTVQKKERTLRVACLGSSGTVNNIADEDRDYNYPDLLRRCLVADPGIKAGFDNVEVMNCGIGGWTTPDVLIDFELNIVHYRPDAAIFYQGLNDLPLHLMEDYSLDYSHGRRNLGEVLHVIKRGYYWPKIPFLHSYEALRDSLVGTGNVRNEVLGRIERQQPDYQRAYRPLIVEEMALRNLCILCRAHGVRLIVGSYGFFLHRDTQRNRKLREGVDLENETYRRVAKEFALPFVDIDATIPKTSEFFVDAVHFTPAGVQFFATSFAAAVGNERCPVG